MRTSTPTLHRTGLAGAAVVLALALAGCGGSSKHPTSSDPVKPASPAPVTLAAANGVKTVRVGLLVSASSPAGQGSDDLGEAAGARVAAFRFGQGGTEVQLIVQADNGTSASAEQAEKALAAKGVAGIVMGSTGDHLDAAIADASKAGIPVLLPYYRPSGDLPAHVWLTGPSRSEVAQRIESALGQQHLTKPFVLTADGVTADGVSAASSLAYKGNLPAQLVTRLKGATNTGRVDSVVVAASAPTQAAIVGLLQGALPDLPIVLTPEALSPVFAKDLASGGVGTVAGDFTTVGPDDGDATTLSATGRGQAAASYFAALRLAASDSQIQNLFNSGPFSQVAATADIPSHDAVVALVDAAEKAGSTTPSAVASALSGLSLDASNGLAGPPLSFSSPEALGAGDVVVLKATTQDPGVRPSPAGAASLFWFAVPTSGGA